MLFETVVGALAYKKLNEQQEELSQESKDREMKDKEAREKSSAQETKEKQENPVLTPEQVILKHKEKSGLSDEAWEQVGRTYDGLWKEAHATTDVLESVNSFHDYMKKLPLVPKLIVIDSTLHFQNEKDVLQAFDVSIAEIEQELLNLEARKTPPVTENKVLSFINKTFSKKISDSKIVELITNKKQVVDSQISTKDLDFLINYQKSSLRGLQKQKEQFQKLVDSDFLNELSRQVNTLGQSNEQRLFTDGVYSIEDIQNLLLTIRVQKEICIDQALALQRKHDYINEDDIRKQRGMGVATPPSGKKITDYL